MKKKKREIIVRIADSNPPNWKAVAESIAMELLKGASENDRQRKVSRAG